ncbi:MAG: patatin-like phospholipase family protein, partial [Pseudomonadota bacterium]|nr:patatin-like phospholipase family protein [Pseudomonadota bacterium]
MKVSPESAPISQFSKLCCRLIDKDELVAFQQSFKYIVPAKEDEHSAAVKFLDETAKLSKEVNILNYAIEHDSYRIIKFILEQVIIANVTSYIDTLEIIKFIDLLKTKPDSQNVDLQAQRHSCKFLLLNIAIQISSHSAINSLLEDIAAAEQFDCLRYADCIRTATRNCNFETLFALFNIEHIARHQAELLPLHLLIDTAFDYASVIEYCYRNLDVQLMDSAGNTPLHLAVARGHERTCAKLAQISNLNLKNRAGFMPMELAVQRDKYEKEDNDKAAALVRILVKAGGDIHGCVTFFNHFCEHITLDGTNNLKQQLIQIENTQIPRVLMHPIHHSRTTTYKFIAFMGGGIKGRVFLPAVEESIKRQLMSLDQTEGYAGTSAGAITALIFSLNLLFKRLEEITRTTKFIEFLDFASPLFEFLKVELEKALSDKFNFTTVMKTIILNLKTIWNSWNEFNQYLGVCKGDVLYKFLYDRVAEGIIGTPLANIDPAHITFRDLAEHPKFFKKLVVFGSNLDTGLSERYSVETTPDDAVLDDTFISACIPYVWIPRPRQVVKINADGTRVREIAKKSVMTLAGEMVKVDDLDIRVDGGLFYNYPVGAFDFDEHGKHKYNEDTLGFYLVEEDHYDTFEYGKPRIEKLQEVVEPKKAEDSKNYGFFTLAGRLINVTMFNQQSLYQKLGPDKNRTIYLNT